MTVPAPKTWVAAEFVDEADLNTELRDALNYLLSPPRCYAYRSAGLSHTSSGNWQVISLDAELYDRPSNTIHSTSSNTSRLVVPDDGTYFLVASASLASNSTGNRGIQLRKNSGGSVAGGTELRTILTDTTQGQSWQFTFGMDAVLNATDYVEMFVFQGSGGTLAYNVGSADLFCSLRWTAKI